MKIDHIFHHLNSFGGAEEHLTYLAELQQAQGDNVNVCLIQATTAQNQYAQRLKAARIPLCQWPVWLSRLSGDWDTREAILRRLIRWLAPLIVIIAAILAWRYGSPRHRVRESVEGRLRRILGQFLHQGHERRLFLLLLTWRYYRHRPDVLHLHSYGAGLEFVLQWAYVRNLAVVYQEHSTPDLTKRGWYELPTGLNMARVVVAVSEISAQALRQFCGVTCPIEVNPPIVAVSGHKNWTSNPAKSDNQVVHILTIARLSEEKGLNYLVEAAERVLAVSPKARFVIYGDGPLRDSLQLQIDAAQLHQQVYLAGSFTRDELPGIMNTADIFVLPSITEGFPLSIVEAMTWGLPIVATAVGGVPELVEDGVTALLCPPCDVKALAQAILTLVDYPDRSHALGAAAREAYLNGRFKPESVVARFTQIYARALQKQ